MTYRDLFEAALRERIAAGGRPQDIERLVNACEGRDSFARMQEFSRWVENDPFDCRRCGAPFWVTGVTHGEDDEVLCGWCRLTYPAVTAEPMPGWRLTWSR